MPLGKSATEQRERFIATPVLNSVTGIRQRLPGTVFEAVFAKVLGLVESKGLLHGRTLRGDGTSLEPKAVMKAIVHARLTHANRGDTRTMGEHLVLTQAALALAASQAEYGESTTEKGCHDTRDLAPPVLRFSDDRTDRLISV